LHINERADLISAAPVKVRFLEDRKPTSLCENTGDAEAVVV
jgi:hypothetical protein